MMGDEVYQCPDPWCGRIAPTIRSTGVMDDGTIYTTHRMACCGRVVATRVGATELDPDGVDE
jgi:hypothetical protein